MAPAILSLDASAQLQALSMRRISAVDLLRQTLRRADETASFNAVVVRDLERALRTAEAIDDRRANGDPLGPLAGLPMTVKDTLDVQGMPASAGVKAFLPRTCVDAEVVRRLREAGAVIWGKTNVPVMASDLQSDNPIYGRTLNPWDETRTPGGSSGGAAAALALGATSLEVGSDIGGSLRIPASFCGVFAHKPTFDLVDRRGHVPPRPGWLSDNDLSVVGPMARSARDLRLLLSVLTQAPLAAQAPPADLRDMKIGVWLDDPFLAVDPEVRRVIAILANGLKARGAQIIADPAPVDSERLIRAYMMLMLSVVGGGLPDGLRRVYQMLRPAAGLALALGAGPRSRALAVRAFTATHREWMIAHEQRARLSAMIAEAFTRYDVLLAPCAPIAAFAHDTRPQALRRIRLSDGRRLPYTALMDWSALPIVCGLPATAMPAGMTPDGLPVGVQVIGPKGADSRTLAVAEAIELAFGGFAPPPRPQA